MRASFLALLVALCFGRNLALRCWENDAESGEIVESKAKDYSYCALVPKPDGPSQVFGLRDGEDSMGAYDASFQQSMNDYSVLTVCLLERYDHRMNLFKTSEFMFRCVCNKDLCNTPTTFGQFLNEQKKDSLK